MMFALYLGYDGYLALGAVCSLFGVELYGQRKTAKNQSERS